MRHIEMTATKWAAPVPRHWNMFAAVVTVAVECLINEITNGSCWYLPEALLILINSLKTGYYGSDHVLDKSFCIYGLD